MEIDEINILRETQFYTIINTILCKSLLEIKTNIENYIYTNKYNTIIEKIDCKYGQNVYVYDIQWRIDVYLEEDIYDDTGRPYGIGCWWNMEINLKKNLIEYMSGYLYNSFVKERNINRNKFIIKFSKLNDSKTIQIMKNETIKYLEALENNFKDNLDLFIKEYKRLKT